MAAECCAPALLHFRPGPSWRRIYTVIEPLEGRALARGPGLWSVDARLVADRGVSRRPEPP